MSVEGAWHDDRQCRLPPIVNEDQTWSTMMAGRVCRFGSPQGMRFESVPRPGPGPGEARSDL